MTSGLLPDVSGTWMSSFSSPFCPFVVGVA
jgi:hypothetical protein